MFSSAPSGCPLTSILRDAMDLSLYLVDGFQMMNLMPEIFFIQVRIAEKISNVIRSKVKVMWQRLLKSCELDSPSR